MAVSLQPFAFFDESGKWRDADLICLCGYLSDEDNWNALLARWTNLCKRHGIPALHMNTYYAEAASKGWDQRKTTDVLLEFSEIIQEHVRTGFAIGLDAKHYRSLPREKKGILGDPADACLQRLLARIRDRFATDGYDGRIAITFDEEEGAAIAMYRTIVRLRNSYPDLGHYIGAVSFADDTFIIPLQAADMIANLTYRWYKDRVAGRVSATDVPEVLRSLYIDAVTGRGRDIEQELWDQKEIDKNLDEFLGREHT